MKITSSIRDTEMQVTAYEKSWMDGVVYKYDDKCYTPIEHVAAIINMCRKVNGNILEIGSNTGVTARNLAMNFRDRIVYAVDYIGRNRTMCPDQSDENPELEVFKDCEDEPNVVCLHAKGESIRYDALVEVGAIFIDGGHTFEEVKADTMNALRFFRTKGGLILWHDCHQDETWSGVHRYVSKTHPEAKLIEETSVAYLFIQGSWLDSKHPQ